MLNLLGRSEAKSTSERSIISFCSIYSLVLVLVDQITKMLIESNFELGERLKLIPNFFNLTYITNKGAAWGIMHGYGWLLLLIALGVIIVTIALIRWLTEGYNERYFAIFTILGGIIGNSIDRIWRGEVVDFLDFYYHNWHWPAFNVADIAICVGVGIFFLSNLIRSKRAKH